jgi:carboxypeptidase A2
MGRLIGIFVLCLLLLPKLGAQMVSYDGYQVWRITVRTLAQLETVQQLARDVWMVRGSTVDVCLSPEEQEQFRKAGFEGEVLIPDVGALIREQQQTEFDPQYQDLFTRYLTLDEIYGAMRQLADQNPRLVQMLEIGRSIENRPIYALRLTRDPYRARVYRDRPQVVINAMQHAREWITTPVVLYFAYRMVAEYPTNTRVRDALNQLEVYVVPVVNPDGYVFTRTTDRLWRKNRRYIGRIGGRDVYGVDLNRNWGFRWGGSGSSSDPNSETYRGSAPFSEPETYWLSRWMLSLPTLRVHVDVHSYSQLILWPWGYTTTRAPFHRVFERVGVAQQQAIRGVYGLLYTIGPIATTLYIASGSATDWVFGARGALSYTYELRDTGRYGFLLPPDQILPNSEEVYPAFLELLRWAQQPDWRE